MVHHGASTFQEALNFYHSPCVSVRDLIFGWWDENPADWTTHLALDELGSETNKII
jgi:hypothetical protein